MIRFVVAAAALFVSLNAFAADVPPASPPPPPAALAAKPFTYTSKATDVVMGSPKAPVTIVEYASLSCPHCAHFFNEVLPTLMTNYIDTGKARLVYHDYPLNAPALKAAELMQCAPKDQRHAFLKVLFNNQNKWVFDPNFKEALANIAGVGGVSRTQFDACMEDKAIEKAVLETAKEAQDDYKVNSTPTFYINGKLEVGDHSADSMSKAIDEAASGSPKK